MIDCGSLVQNTPAPARPERLSAPGGTSHKDWIRQFSMIYARVFCMDEKSLFRRVQPLKPAAWKSSSTLGAHEAQRARRLTDTGEASGDHGRLLWCFVAVALMCVNSSTQCSSAAKVGNS